MTRRPRYYVRAADGTVHPCHDSLEFARWFEDVERRRIARDRIGGFEVSTIFLGIDHRFEGLADGEPVLWETMVFADVGVALPDDVPDTVRYTSEPMARLGHDGIVGRLLAWMGEQDAS